MIKTFVDEHCTGCAVLHMIAYPAFNMRPWLATGWRCVRRWRGMAPKGWCAVCIADGPVAAWVPWCLPMGLHWVQCHAWRGSIASMVWSTLEPEGSSGECWLHLLPPTWQEACHTLPWQGQCWQLMLLPSMCCCGGCRALCSVAGEPHCPLAPCSVLQVACGMDWRMAGCWAPAWPPMGGMAL